MRGGQWGGMGTGHPALPYHQQQLPGGSSWLHGDFYLGSPFLRLQSLPRPQPMEHLPSFSSLSQQPQIQHFSQHMEALPWPSPLPTTPW